MGRDVPTLYLVAEDDTALPLAGMHELYETTAATKRMIILRKADHAHFFDTFEQRTGQCPAQEAHLFTRSLTLCLFDAWLRADQHAQCFLDGDVGAELAASMLCRKGIHDENLPLAYGDWHRGYNEAKLLKHDPDGRWKGRRCR